MRLSEAIQLGAMMTSQAFRTLFKGDGACALGAALLAVGVAPEQAGRSVRAHSGHRDHSDRSIVITEIGGS